MVDSFTVKKELIIQGNFLDNFFCSFQRVFFSAEFERSVCRKNTKKCQGVYLPWDERTIMK